MNRTRDLMKVVAIAVIALLAAIYFYAFESLAAWVQRYDAWQVDALLFLPIILVTVLALYYWRKHRQLEGEVAERRRMEETLRQQRDLYEGMLTAQSELGEGLVVIEDERIRYANDAFCGISGYGAEDGRRVDIEVAFKVLEAEDCFRSVVIIRDVTGRKLAEARLREAEERYLKLVENIAAVTYIQRSPNRILTERARLCTPARR